MDIMGFHLSSVMSQWLEILYKWSKQDCQVPGHQRTECVGTYVEWLILLRTIVRLSSEGVREREIIQRSKK